MTSEDSPTQGGVPVDFDPFWGPVVETGAPSTEAQREIWLALRLDPDARSAFNECASLILTGSLNREALTLALRDVITHHDALRIIFSDDGLSLAFAVPFDPPLAFHDLTPLSSSDVERRTQEILRENSGTAFDMRLGPLIRFVLIRQSASTHLLAITAHHIVCDGWSMGVLVKDLGDAYSARARGGTPSLDAAQSFADYARARSVFEKSPERVLSLDFWEKTLSPPPDPIELPYSSLRPTLRSYRSERVDHHLTLSCFESAKKAATQCRVTFSTLFLGAFSGFLSRISEQHDIIVGLPAAEQALIATPRLVGHCANLLPVRLAVDPDAECAKLLAHTSEQVSRGFEHARVSLGAILERLHLTRDPSRAPLLAIMCNVDKTPAPKDCSFFGLEVLFSTVPRTSENFELSLNALVTQNGVVLETQYNSDLFSRETVLHLLECFECFFTELCKDPSQPLSRLPLLPPKGLAHIRHQWNETEKRFEHPPETTSLHSLVFDRSDFSPSAVATEDSKGSLSYGDLERISARFAHALRAAGVVEGAFVGVILSRDRFLPAWLLGVLRAGAAYVPLDPAHPDDRLRIMAMDSGISLLITDPNLEARALMLFKHVISVKESSESLQPSLPTLSSTERPAYAIYTSGSTGRPKAVAVPHRAVTNFLQSVRDRPGVTTSDRMLALTTIGFDISVLELFLPLASGGTVYIAPTEHAVDPGSLERTLTEARISVMQATPSTWRMLLSHGWKGQQDLKALCGGEPRPTDLVDLLVPRVGALWNMYGPTETTVWSSCSRVESGRTISIGTPLANTSFFIVDHQGSFLPIGAKGELCIAGAGLALGYLNRPELTEEKFVVREDYCGTPLRMYRTGDVARWNWDGSVELFGRKDSQVKVRGFRIEIGEIENAIRSHEVVKDVVVTVREDRPGDQRIVAYILTSTKGMVTASELRTFLRRTLPDYMIPQHVLELDAFPLTPSGKVNRRALPAPFVVQEQRVYLAPKSANEILVSRVWREFLRRDAIDIHDNFFTIGGHSLLALQVISALERETGYTVPVRSMLLKTLEQIAVELPASDPKATQNEPTVERTGGTMLQKLFSRFRR